MSTFTYRKDKKIQKNHYGLSAVERCYAAQRETLLAGCRGVPPCSWRSAPG